MAAWPPGQVETTIIVYTWIYQSTDKVMNSGIRAELPFLLSSVWSGRNAGHVTQFKYGLHQLLFVSPILTILVIMCCFIGVLQRMQTKPVAASWLSSTLLPPFFFFFNTNSFFCLFLSTDDNQFEMDIWAPVLPPVESYLLNTTKVNNDCKAFHKSFFFTFFHFFTKSLCKEPKTMEKLDN